MFEPEVKRFIAVMVIVLAIVVILYGIFQFLLHNAKAVEKGELFPWVKAEVTRVRFFDRWDFYTAFENLPSLDLITAYTFSAAGWSAFIIYGLGTLWGQRRKDRTFSLFFWLGLFFTWFAADEYFGLHETIGFNLLWLRKLPFVRRPDDVIIIGYGAAAVLGVFVFRRFFLADKLTFSLLVVAALIGLTAGFGDFLGGPGRRILYYYEEFAEIAVPLIILFSILRLGTVLLRKTASLPPAKE